MRLQLLSLVSLGILANVAVAQNETDALRFSQTYMKGSARFTAMGGAFGALGGDVSSFMVNPAGAGVYRTSEFAFSTGIFNANLNSIYRDGNAFESRSALNIGNAGVVVPIFASSEKALRFLNFGVAYNRINDFGMNTYTTGYNAQNSITDYFAANADGIPVKDFLNFDPQSNDWSYKGLPWESVLAWKTYLISPEENAGVKYENITNYNSPLEIGDGVFQDQWKSIRGFNDVVNITVGGNIFDLVYFGSSLNINNINYRSIQTYKEESEANNKSNFRSLMYEEDYRAYGTGYSLSFGVILKPIQELRVGVSYQSPTWNFIDEEYSAYMDSYFIVNPIDGDGWADCSTPISEYSYRVHSPQKLTGSIAGVIGSLAILSADVDWVNYNNMKMKGDRIDRSYFSEVNGVISNTYRNTVNVRSGAEFKLGSLALRGGYQYYQNPYKSEYVDSKHPTEIVSAGFGYRDRDCFIDFAYSYMVNKSNYPMYDYYSSTKDIYSGLVSNKIRRNSYILTVGIKM